MADPFAQAEDEFRHWHTDTVLTPTSRSIKQRAEIRDAGLAGCQLTGCVIVGGAHHLSAGNGGRLGDGPASGRA